MSQATTVSNLPGKAGHRRRVSRRLTRIGLAFALPALLLMAYSNFVPALWNFVLAFQAGNLRQLRWVGIANFQRALSDDVFQISLWHSVFIAVIVTLCSVLLGVTLALLIYRLGRGEGMLYRLIIFMPTMLPLAIIGLLFSFVFNKEMGILNQLLRLVGADALVQAWLAKPPLNLYAICAVGIWRIVGLPMIFTYAALQSIPDSLLEAGTLDGASYVDQVRLIILPLVKPVIGTAAIFTFIVNFKAFDLVYVLTRGGPGDSTRVVPLHIIDTAFTFNEFGYAAAMGVIMTLVILVLSRGIGWLLRSEDYEY